MLCTAITQDEARILVGIAVEFDLVYRLPNRVGIVSDEVEQIFVTMNPREHASIMPFGIEQC